jgi:hypothetical protein
VSGPVASTWLSNADERAQGRQRRLAEATPFVPPDLWVMLIGGAVVVISLPLGFADRSERALGQALIAAAPAAILASGLVLIRTGVLAGLHHAHRWASRLPAVRR